MKDEEGIGVFSIAFLLVIFALLVSVAWIGLYKTFTYAGREESVYQNYCDKTFGEEWRYIPEIDGLGRTCANRMITCDERPEGYFCENGWIYRKINVTLAVPLDGVIFE